MRILALDTTARRGSFALAEDGQIVASRVVDAPDGFAGAVYGAVDALLAEAGWKLADIDAFAAASGPGSFTGIRVGLATAKALAEALGKAVIPVTTLEALAFAAPGDLRAPVLDARRGEVFAAVYDAELRAAVEPVVGPWAQFQALVGDRRPTYATVAEKAFAPEGVAPLPEDAARVVIPCVADPLARLAAKRLASGGGLAPEAVDAAYIRRPDAERNWKG